MLCKTLLPAALLVSIALPAAALDGFEVYQHARPYLVKIAAVSADGRLQLGSGVALPNGTIVTNCHVTLRAKRVQLSWGGSASSASLEAATVTHDLCTLHFPGFKREGVKVGATRDLRVGDPVYALGYNAGQGLSYQPGEVAQLYEHDGGMVVRTTAAFTHGASGGGLFDQSGRLVGILTFFRVSKDRTDYFAVPVEWFRELQAATAQDIAPLNGVPFWADEVGRQPAFLQAGTLEADSRWDELAAFARGWVDTTPENAQAWVALGKAAAKLGDRAVAEDAFRRAEALGARMLHACRLPTNADCLAPQIR